MSEKASCDEIVGSEREGVVERSSDEESGFELVQNGEGYSGPEREFRVRMVRGQGNRGVKMSHVRRG